MKKFVMAAVGGTVAGALIATQVAGPLIAQEAERKTSVYEQLDLFGDIFERIRAQYVEDVDETFNRAVEAGATVERPLQDQFYGDRSGTVVDPFGHKWTICTHIEDLTPEEIQKRMAEAMPETAPGAD